MKICTEIREYCRSFNWKIDGKLTRRKDLETKYDFYLDEDVPDPNVRVYVDDSGNEYDYFVYGLPGIVVYDKEGWEIV